MDYIPGNCYILKAGKKWKCKYCKNIIEKGQTHYAEVYGTDYQKIYDRFHLSCALIYGISLEWEEKINKTLLKLMSKK